MRQPSYHPPASYSRLLLAHAAFQYIHDLTDSPIVLINSDETRLVNLGNGDEFAILEFACLVREVIEDVVALKGS
jgi:hypothetical protein